MRDIGWREEFPSIRYMPGFIEDLVRDGKIEDMSWKNDPCPSFGSRLPDKNFVRIWVEHHSRKLRKGWFDRFTIVVQPDPSIQFGRRVVATEDPLMAQRKLLEILKGRGLKARQGRFLVRPAKKA